MQRSWAHVRVRRAYPEFVSELDMLTPEDVVWEPYNPLRVRRQFGQRQEFPVPTALKRVSRQDHR